MGAIYYTANSRANLIQDSPAHTAGTEYSFDVKINAWNTNIETPNRQIVTLGGQVETILYRTGKVVQARFGPYPNSEQAQIEEFLLSIAGGEIFQVDPEGSVATPDELINVISIGSGFDEERIDHGFTPNRYISMVLRRV